MLGGALVIVALYIPASIDVEAASSNGAIGSVRETEVTAVFVVHRGQLVSSSCNGARPIRIVVAEAYPELARLVHPLRRNVLNGITLTVRWHEMPNDPSIDPYGRVPAPDPSARIVTHISAVGNRVSCRSRPDDSPIVGSSWNELVDGEVRIPHWTFTLQVFGFRAADGCNRGHGPYQLKGNQLTFGAYMQTLIVCGDKDDKGQFRRMSLDQDWFGTNVPLKVSVHGRVMRIESPDQPARTFIANEWD